MLLLMCNWHSAQLKVLEVIGMYKDCLDTYPLFLDQKVVVNTLFHEGGQLNLLHVRKMVAKLIALNNSSKKSSILTFNDSSKMMLIALDIRIHFLIFQICKASWSKHSLSCFYVVQKTLVQTQVQTKSIKKLTSSFHFKCKIHFGRKIQTII